ncbi:sugar ABC transporter ATP-binding protein [Pseudogemmobacter humi]|uniref:Xylose import ATP-binding protein XylG n=1 Tax=Pseudogemmobacter humi TaxID=2483812 RepID=A0A3P5XPJ3_9RHOB|nr:sugar ABC transporter ATP-binding protein [Pseudogemmobacter humi]VDC33629.1 Xylose import ATP-binding protein XylG [Pseudogemmobacter humi]
MPDPIFEARNISKRFGPVRALNEVSIAIGAGELHSIIGENGAGKSTLMNIFCGRLRPDTGALLIDRQPVHFSSPKQAAAAGIAIAPQEINLVPALSVAENIMLGAQIGARICGGAVIDWKATRAEAIRHLHEVDDQIDPASRVGDLSKAQQQLVQIARAAATDARILILDEPTATLTHRETARLFDYIRSFKARGHSIFYISHRLDEVKALSDRITVLRDGALAGTLDPATATREEMVTLMAGRPPSAMRQEPRRIPGDAPVVLKVTGLTRPGEFQDLSFSLRKGEILGVSGLIGSGRTEMAKCLFGLTRATAGEIEYFGQKTRFTSPLQAIQAGLIYLPEERKQEGIFPLLSIVENAAMPSMARFRGLLAMRNREMLAEVMDYIALLKTRIGSPRDAITTLSGGNQQKVIIARWLMRDAKVLIMDEPTRGIDVNAKFEIQAVLRRLTEERGLSIILISSEMEEVLDVADRILVMHEGRARGIVDAAGESQESLLKLAMT